MDEKRAIINKILSAGSPLSERDVKVHCGVGAGYRNTFVVDDASTEGKYVCAVLNSTLARWFALHAPSAACSKAAGIEDMPIPRIGADEARAFAKVVDEILAAKAADPQADTGEYETELDWYVYHLYGLTPYEVAEVDGFQVMTVEDLEDYGLLLAMEEVADEETVDFEEVETILREWNEARA